MAEVNSYYAYDPKPGVAIAFAVLVGLSLIVHVYQNWLVTKLPLYETVLHNSNIKNKVAITIGESCSSWSGVVFATLPAGS